MQSINFGLSLIFHSKEYKELRKYLGILLNPLSHADVGVERYKEEIKQVIQIIKDINDLHDKYKLETIISGGNNIQISQNSANGDLYIATYELSDSLYKLTDNQNNIVYSDFMGKIISYEFHSLSGTVKSGTLNGNTLSMKVNHQNFMDKYKLFGSANWMDDLYKLDGTKLIQASL
jgi:hypothetical protein